MTLIYLVRSKVMRGRFCVGSSKNRSILSSMILRIGWVACPILCIRPCLNTEGIGSQVELLVINRNCDLQRINYHLRTSQSISSENRQLQLQVYKLTSICCCLASSNSCCCWRCNSSSGIPSLSNLLRPRRRCFWKGKTLSSNYTCKSSFKRHDL